MTTQAEKTNQNLPAIQTTLDGALLPKEAFTTSRAIDLPFKMLTLKRRTQWDKLFDGFTQMKAISFVVQPVFLLEYFSQRGYEKIELLVGKGLTDQYKEKMSDTKIRVIEELHEIKDNSRPVVFSNRGFGMTPMEQGLRVVGTVEFGGLNNPLSKSRIKNLSNGANFMLNGLPKHEDEWLGFRPTLPDFLPVIGLSKNYKNVYYSFGHHHLGWTLAAISGKIISKMIANENTNLDLEPYSSKRF